MYSLTESDELDISKLLASPIEINEQFCRIWGDIIKKTDIAIDCKTAISEIKNLVLYEALDGNRSTMVAKPAVPSEFEGALYTLNFIRVLQSLGAKTCYIMIHTSYNRARGEKEFNSILKVIKKGAPLIKQYGMNHDIFCSCICPNKHHELFNILMDVTSCTKQGTFTSHFFFDYSEEWGASEDGKKTIQNLPNIDVHIRHTKFQFSGGWVPGKMSRSVFLYSQNGSLYSNWNSEELITLISIALLAKLLHRGEGLDKTYENNEEIINRFKVREQHLFNKTIYLRKEPKKLCMIGSPKGIYQFYC